MADGLSAAECNAYVDASAAKGTYYKLHTGDPGGAGTANAAGNTTRRQATMNAAGTNTAGMADSTADLVWSAVGTAETYTHLSRWTTVGPAGGTFLGKGALTAPKTVAVGDDFKIAAGGLHIAMTPAS